MDLGICPIGSAVTVRWIDLDDDERARMRELGIREGAVLHVVNCGAFGSRVVAVGSDRFAIDGRTCACIAVIRHDDDGAVVGSRDIIVGNDKDSTTASPKPGKLRNFHLAKPAEKGHQN